MESMQPDPPEFVSADWVAMRWSVARATAVRVLERAGVAVFFLSGAQRGVRRYRRADVVRVESEAESRGEGHTMT